MGHRGKRSKESIERRRAEFLKRHGFPSVPLKHYDVMYYRKKFQVLKRRTPRILDSQYKDTLRMQVGKCQICGWDAIPDALVIHHIDKNPQNNHRSNLAVLCRNCHYLLHKGLAMLREGVTVGT